MLRTTDLPYVRSYADAVALADRYADRAYLTNNTDVRRDGDAVCIRLHRTDVLRFTRTGVVLDSGGWQTVTTRQRLNAFIGHRYTVSQRNFEWTVTDRQTGDVVPFSDGMRLPY